MRATVVFPVPGGPTNTIWFAVRLAFNPCTSRLRLICTCVTIAVTCLLSSG